MTILKHTDLTTILLLIFCFADDFIKNIIRNIKFSLKRPDQNTPPTKKHNLSIAELISLAIFRFFTGHKSWKEFYRHIKTYHLKDFPKLPTYWNFLSTVNNLSHLASIMLQGFMHVFRRNTKATDLKYADSSKLPVCHIKREFNHKVVKDLANKSKSSMGWFYGFRLHIVVNDLMRILNYTIGKATSDDRKVLEMIWNDIFGTIIADAGYVGKEIFERGLKLGKFLFAAVRSNMKKLLTETQHQILKMRMKVEVVFSVLKLRMGLENSLPRSPLGHFAHYTWCITAYQLKKFFEFAGKPLFASQIGVLA
jgi:Transposase DDE domain